MSRECELTGKKPMVGHTVSHSNIKTKRRYLPNLVNVTVHSDALGQSYSARVSAAALRTVDKRGGLDAFLAKARDEDLSAKMLKVKKAIAKKNAEAAAQTWRDRPRRPRRAVVRLSSASRISTTNVASSGSTARSAPASIAAPTNA